MGRKKQEEKQEENGFLEMNVSFRVLRELGFLPPSPLGGLEGLARTTLAELVRVQAFSPSTLHPTRLPGWGALGAQSLHSPDPKGNGRRPQVLFFWQDPDPPTWRPDAPPRYLHCSLGS